MKFFEQQLQALLTGKPHSTRCLSQAQRAVMVAGCLSYLVLAVWLHLHRLPLASYLLGLTSVTSTWADAGAGCGTVGRVLDRVLATAGVLVLVWVNLTSRCWVFTCLAVATSLFWLNASRTSAGKSPAKVWRYVLSHTVWHVWGAAGAAACTYCAHGAALAGM